MKIATIRNGDPDGRLVVVSRDGTRFVAATGIARTLQEAMENWSIAEPALRQLAGTLEADVAAGEPIRSADLAAPLPRAWQWLDGSTYLSHAVLMSRVFRMDLPPTDRPLMYQGASDHFYGPYDDLIVPTEADGIDFEGEFGVVTDEVPMGTDARRAAEHIRLIVQINDWSLRALAPIEMKTGFGWIQAKPHCSMAPFAVTPDELGQAWRDGRVALPLEVKWNAEPFGVVDGYPMAFSFAELVAHAARTRKLVAGTVIGSGTISNENYREVGSACIAERRGIELADSGEARTPFMSFGDTVEMEARGLAGETLFGRIVQKVAQG
ncbi:fumarylacetoacetate hydrolase family protein [Novosphingobium sp. SG720]|uniref:fumarylacetoacetate hydrolase family protein n=1 Tax=Novosphingobium sp. SG720 TaxID=2586998 RepID=UPI001445A999|nr:fumarylacetoacetate hydrolase family protein [Novosphingobium sp. SG720]NKJ44824.1 fumarylacetoacetate (FAA) hydrolase [Novosphingobium sp. SG720]